MRQIWKFPLDFANGEPVTVDMPEGAQVVHFDTQAGTGSLMAEALSVPTVWALVDDDNPPETRRFAVYGTGHPVPRGALHVGSYQRRFHGEIFVWHVLELVGEPLPAGLDLPADAEAAYRTLTSAGFRHVDDRMPTARWVAPDDEPLTTEQMMAVATLQEHGFGAVTSK